MIEAELSLASAFPRSVRSELDTVSRTLSSDSFRLHFDSAGPIQIGDEFLAVLTRTYLNVENSGDGTRPANQPRFRIYDALSSLSAAVPLEREIYSCIQSRDCSGFHRIEFVGLVLQGTNEFSVPFFFQLACDYIVPIAERVFARLPTLSGHRRSQIMAFAEENPRWLERTAQRVITHWNHHQRCWIKESVGAPQYVRLGNYPAYRTLNELGLWPEKLAQHRLRQERQASLRVH